MVSLWIIIGLFLATLSVSILGAAFSIVGLGALFSGAALAVWAMAGSLEFAKFVLAAYIHQRWDALNRIYRTYLVFAIFVLSAITSMGIFGFLSDAYQSASSAIDGETIKLESLKAQQESNTKEIARLTKAIDEIPDSRISRKMKFRAETEPAILQLTKSNEEVMANITQSNLKLLDIKKRVGPLIYIARAFQIDVDTAVKYLILVFVSVFDPLAICLVIAFNQAIESRRKYKLEQKEIRPQVFTEAPVVINPMPTSTSETLPMTAEAAVAPTPAAQAPAAEDAPDILEMRYSEEDKQKEGKAV